MTKERFGNKDYIPSMKLSGVCDSLGVTGKKFGGGVCSVTCEVTEQTPSPNFLPVTPNESQTPDSFIEGM